MALVLESIFKTKNPFGIVGLARESESRQNVMKVECVPEVLLNFLGTMEIGKRKIPTSPAEI